MDIERIEPARAARLLFQLPKQCRVYCAINPSLQWGWPEVLANQANYLLGTLVWQKTKDGQRNRSRPKLYTPDFMKGPQVARETEAHTVDDVRAILALPRH